MATQHSQDRRRIIRLASILVFTLLSLGWYACADIWGDHNHPPTITSSASATGIINLPFSYTASAEDPENKAITYSYSGLPDWLTVEGKAVHGIPEREGRYQFRITAQDNDGESDRITVTVQVSSNTGLIESIVEAVSLDSLLDVAGKLSGQSNIDIGDESYSVKTRLTYFAGNELAAKYLEWKLAGFGLMTRRFEFSQRGSNVIALQQGSVFPDSIYIIGAHYDCQVIGDEDRPEDIRDAPGADNNASGVAAVLEAARILSQYTTRYSILYVLWDEHENVPEDIDQSGLLGSTAYAEHTIECNMRIAGVIDLDMIAYDSDDDGRMAIIGSTLGRSPQMTDQAIGMINRFNLNLKPHIMIIELESDSVPFHRLGYSTINFTEDVGNNLNLFNYRNGDTIDKFNNSYYHRMAKLVIATLAHLAGVESEGILPRSTFWFCV
ncbi:M28 family peptidase [Candidatus Neomarinimicrobiota bacterium]